MKHRLKVFGLLGLLWVLFFGLARIIFLLYQFPLTLDLSLYEILMPVWLGLRMDLAMAAYWLILPGLALVASFFIAEKIIRLMIILIFYGLSIFSVVVIVADLELYRHWGFRMDTTPLLYTGPEGISSLSIGIFFLLVGIFGLLITSLHWSFRKFVLDRLTFQSAHWRNSIIMFLVVALLFIPIRSSFRVAPLNTGVVYFHKSNPFPNHAGINVVWNFLKSVVSDNSFKYPSDFLDETTARETFSKLMRTSNVSTRVLNQSKPNILLIILESFTSKIIEPLGGLPGITPNLNQLCREGILFTDFYASGDRTDKGLVSILSGYPAQPKTSIIKFPNKTEGLPSLPKVLARRGYLTSFVYGGDIGFANMESYLNIVGFSHITEDDDFDAMLNTSKWGVHDQFVFDRLLIETDTASQNIGTPFFKTMLSLSSHEPFDVPFRQTRQKDESDLFLNSCTYTDSCLGQFINLAKQKEWWENTLIIITADHGHRFPLDNPNYDKRKFKIPMLWIGGAVDTSMQIHKIGSQTDIVNTLLGQFDLKNDDFAFSKDLLSDESTSFAVYSYNNGFGYLDATFESVYDFDLKNYLIPDSILQAKDLAKGKAYLQMLFNDYNKR